MESFEIFKTDKDNLLVPYNCQFIVCYSIGEEKYELTEVYKVKNRTFTSQFGILDRNKLVIKKNFLFSRRMNLNGTEMEMNFDENVNIKHF